MFLIKNLRFLFQDKAELFMSLKVNFSDLKEFSSMLQTKKQGWSTLQMEIFTLNSFVSIISFIETKSVLTVLKIHTLQVLNPNHAWLVKNYLKQSFHLKELWQV